MTPLTRHATLIKERSHSVPQFPFLSNGITGRMSVLYFGAATFTTVGKVFSWTLQNDKAILSTGRQSPGPHGPLHSVPLWASLN